MPIDASLHLQGAQLRNQNNQQLLQSLQSGIDTGLKMKALKAEEAKAGLDLEKLASGALIKAHNGQELTPQDMSVLKAFDALETRKLAVDPTTGNYRKVNASILDSLPTSVPSTPQGFNLGALGPQGQGSNPAIRQGYADIQPMPLNIAGIEQQLQGTPVDTQTSVPPQGFNLDAVRPQPSMPTEILDNPAATQKFKESYAAEAGKGAGEKAINAPKAEASLRNYVTKQKNIDETINKAIGKTGWLSAGAAEGTKDIGGTPAANLEALLNTIAADSAFAELQSMREASKTGGALGAISEKELALLTSAQAALTQKQSPDQLKENLRKYQQIRTNALQNVKDAYLRDYGTLPPDLQNTSDVSTTPQTQADFDALPSGTIYIDPDDGKKYRKP